MSREGMSHVVAYALTTVLLAAAALLVIPALVGETGLQGWGAIAAGQAVGAIASIVISYGWGVSGPAVIAAGELGVRRREFLDSLRVRSVLLGAVLLVAILLAALVSNGFPVLSILGCVSTAIIAMTNGWYFIGAGEPWMMFISETLPRVVLTAFAIIALYGGVGVEIALLLILLGGLLAALLSALIILRSVRGTVAAAAERLSVPFILRTQRSNVTTAITGAMYSYLPVVVVSAAFPSIIGAFALVDKVQKQAGSGLTPVLNFLQGWVPRGGPKTLRNRARAAARGGLAGSLLIVFGLSVAGPILLRWLSGGVIENAVVLSVLLAIAVALTFLEVIIARACVIPLLGGKDLAQVTVWGSLVGLALLLPAVAFFGTEGALAALIIGLSIRLLILAILLRRA